VAATLALGTAVALAQTSRTWKSLREDGIHDPDGPAIGVLQEPALALSGLPADHVGNQVRWIEALREGHINPRTNIRPETEVEVLDLDILMKRTGEMPMVLFPHRRHTEWLDCDNCHDRIFERKAGATRLNMFTILQGNHCGQCHGAVAFPLTECRRCHSVPRKPMIQ
jgi:c(7)-type cytochrome triheme protein